MKRFWFVVFVLVFMVTGCAHNEYNDRVATTNVTMFSAFGDAMAKQTSEGGRMAVNTAYMLRAGQQDYQRDDTVLDYSKGLLPWMALALPFIYSSNDDSQSITSGRDTYISSTRADSAYNYQSATQEYLTGGDGVFSSNDQEAFATSDHYVEETP